MLPINLPVPPYPFHRTGHGHPKTPAEKKISTPLEDRIPKVRTYSLAAPFRCGTAALIYLSVVVVVCFFPPSYAPRAGEKARPTSTSYDVTSAVKS
ncbi:hypothetical protein QE152_g36239 [Popillia japonica]|uniref:Transmembrane protein n=1 Tax=Popillia japonica TaxID=7064 RepID=A0AAW1IDS5_POPJA